MNAIKQYPSIFQAWNGVTQTDLKGEDAEATIARHDLAWLSDIGLRKSGDWLDPYFTPQSIASACALRDRLRAMNPAFVLLQSVGYTDALIGELPDDSPFWKRSQGQLVPVWQEGNTYALDLHNPEYQDIIALRARVTMETGAVQGIMLDWWVDDDDHLAIIKKVRAAIGETALIIGNMNRRLCPATIGYFNGVFMECGHARTAADWQEIVTALDFNEARVRTPKINCLETFYNRSRDDFADMRAVTCLSLTHSDGHVLFSDPNELHAPDHYHSWYRFWNKSLGQPTGKLAIGRDGMHRREFEKGVAVFNPPNNPNNRVVNFTAPKKSIASNKINSRFLIGSPDGGIYLNK